MGGINERGTTRLRSVVGPVSCSMFTNDLFLFIEKCTLYAYVDDNTMVLSSWTLQNVFSKVLIA